MFTAQEVIEPALSYTGIDEPSNDVIINIVNTGINRLNALGLCYGEDELTIDSDNIDTYISMTDNILGVSIVLDENGNNFERWQFKQDSDIKINKEGVFYPIYKKITPNISAVDENIELNKVYHSALTQHAEAFLKLQMHDNSPDGQRLMNHFERLATEAYNNLVISRMPANIRTSQQLSGILAGTAGGGQNA